MSTSRDDKHLQTLYDYLADTLESPDMTPPVLDARPIDPSVPVDDKTRRRYFLKNIYPYAEAMPLGGAPASKS